jgi:hypothetical protein
MSIHRSDLISHSVDEPEMVVRSRRDRTQVRAETDTDRVGGHDADGGDTRQRIVAQNGLSKSSPIATSQKVDVTPDPRSALLREILRYYQSNNSMSRRYASIHWAGAGKTRPGWARAKATAITAAERAAQLDKEKVKIAAIKLIRQAGQIADFEVTHSDGKIYIHRVEHPQIDEHIAAVTAPKQAWSSPATSSFVEASSRLLEARVSPVFPTANQHGSVQTPARHSRPALHTSPKPQSCPATRYRRRLHSGSFDSISPVQKSPSPHWLLRQDSPSSTTGKHATG